MSDPLSASSAERSRLDQLHAAATATARVLDLARALAHAGRKIDLAGIDGKIGLICAQALDLPPGLGREFVPTLRTLIAKIDGLKTKIT